jgi:hypothetical protein
MNSARGCSRFHFVRATRTSEGMRGDSQKLADGGDASRRTPPARALLASSRRALFCPARRGRWEGLIRKGVSRVSTQRPMENQNSSGYGSISHEDVAHLDRSGPVARQKIPAKCAVFSIY